MMKFCKNLFSIVILTVLVVSFAGCDKKEPERKQEKAVVTFTGPEDMKMFYNGRAMDGLQRRLPVGTYVFKFTAPGFNPVWKQIRIEEKSPSFEENIEMVPEKGVLRISCFVAGNDTEQGARVFCDGKEYGVTPCLITGLDFGEHVIELKHSGYVPATLTCELSADSPMKQLSATLTSENSVLQVSGDPEGVVLRINGEEVGSTPWKGVRLAGKCLIELRAPGYRPYSREITLRSGVLHKVPYRLEPAPSTLEVISEPAHAVCFVNGEKKGTTPLKIVDVIPQRRCRIRVEYPGFEPVEKSIEVKPQSDETLKFVLERASGDLRLNVRPAGVEIFVDGKPLQKSVADPRKPGETLPVELKNIAPGTHQVRLYHRYGKTRNGKAFIRNFTVRKNQLTISPVLELWVANADITFDNGETSRVKIIRETADSVEFSPIVGITVTESKLKIKKIMMLDE